jgi:hypothetical protein
MSHGLPGFRPGLRGEKPTTYWHVLFQHLTPILWTVFPARHVYWLRCPSAGLQHKQLTFLTSIITNLYFILVRCILLRYVYVYLSNIPAIATENLLVLHLFSLFTTCFGPYGPSSGEIQLHHIFWKAIDTITDPLFYNCSLIWCKSLF